MPLAGENRIKTSYLDVTINGLLVVQELLHWIYTSEYSDREDYWLVMEKKRAYLSSEAAQYVPSYRYYVV